MQNKIEYEQVTIKLPKGIMKLIRESQGNLGETTEQYLQRCVVETVSSTINVTSHTVTLTGLTLGITYYCRVQSTDNSGTATSLVFTFNLYSSSAVIVTISYPQAITYTSGSVQIGFTASGGTIDKMWINFWNGTDWVYVSNQTYTGSPSNLTTITLASGTYMLYAYANNTLGTVGYSTVTFTVQVTVTIPFRYGGWWGDWWGAG